MAVPVAVGAAADEAARAATVGGPVQLVVDEAGREVELPSGAGVEVGRAAQELVDVGPHMR